MVVDPIKCVVVGDGGVGKSGLHPRLKTCLLLAYSTNKFPDDYVPSVLDCFETTVIVGDEPYTYCLFDTAGQEDYDRMRPLTYDKTDVFLVCFNIVSPPSFENCQEKWFPEVHHHVPGGVPCVLVGLQADLRNNPKVLEDLKKKKQTPIPQAAGEALAKAMGARRYLEASSLTRDGVKTVFEEAVIAALEPPATFSKKKECVIV